jgi:putative Mg2+ transporter-C (MgtC) family protein
MDAGSFFTSLYASEVGFSVVVIRLLVAVGLGALLGFDREILSRPAGIRTHILVSLAAATFTIITFELIERARIEGAPNADPIRIIEAVTAGVAFLAAGAIIQARGKVHGVTTGAGLWLAGAIGTACGVGAFSIAILAAFLGFAVLVVLRWVEAVIPKKAPPPGREDRDD